jgi:hypothetical protein
MSQTELLKKGIKEVPIWCYGSNTREKLSKEPKYTLHEEDAKALKEAKILKKKMMEEDRKEAEEPDCKSVSAKKKSVNVQEEE